MTTARLGTTGYCSFDGEFMPCSSQNAWLENGVGFFEHVVGLRDSNYVGTSSKGKGAAANAYQRRMFRNQPAVAKASFSGNVTEKILKKLFSAAKTGAEVPISLSFARDGTTKLLKNAIVSSFGLEVSAGELITVSVEAVAKDILDTDETGMALCDKLLPWQAFNITTILGEDLMAFSLRVLNPVKPIWTAKGGTSEELTGYKAELLPIDLRIGMQEVSGTVSSFSPAVWKDTDSIQMVASCGAIAETVNVVYAGTKTSTGGSSLVLSTTEFFGVKDGSVWS